MGRSGSWRGIADITPAIPNRLSAWDAGGVPGVAACAGRRFNRGLHAPLVRLCSMAVMVGRHTVLLGATLATSAQTKGETVKLLGNPEGQRYRSGVATSQEHHVVAWG